MRFNYLMIFVLIICLIGFACCKSSTQSEFLISGCDSSEGSIPLGGCSTSREYYCNNTGSILGTLLNTKTDAGACTLSVGFCCPKGFVCDSSGICEMMIFDCSFYNDISHCSGGACDDDCKDNGCWWINNVCFSPYSPSLGCSVYTSPTSCSKDIYNLGKYGSGSQVCQKGQNIGGLTVISNSCLCAWNGSSCSLRWNSTETINTGNPKWFTCARSENVSECVDGKQDISWAVSVPAFAVYTSASAIPTTDLKASECVSGNSTIPCGEAVVQLDFFGFFNAFLVLCSLIIFYIFRN